MPEKDSFTTSDGLRLYTRTWVPSGEPAASVILLHGYGDHCGRYAGFARALNGESIAVYSYDQRGFGRSDGRRGYVGDFAAILSDLDLFVRHIAPDTAGKPVFMLGQSFGGLIVVRYAQTRQPGLTGLVLCSPLLAFPDSVPKPLLALGRYIAVVAPWLPVSSVDPQGLSRRPEVVKEAEDDPLNYHGSVRARTGAQMQQAVADAFAEVEQLALPLYIVHGSADRVVPASGSQRLFEASTATDKTLRVFDGGYHELWQDLDADVVIRSVCDWIRERLSP